jgi:hypothetical protein
MLPWHPTPSRRDERPFSRHRRPPHFDVPIRSRIRRLGSVAVFTSTHHPGTVARACCVGEGATVFANALGLVEGRVVVGETGDGLLEERELVSTVSGGPKAVEAGFPC